MLSASTKKAIADNAHPKFRLMSYLQNRMNATHIQNAIHRNIRMLLTNVADIKNLTSLFFRFLAYALYVEKTTCVSSANRNDITPIAHPLNSLTSLCSRSVSTE